MSGITPVTRKEQFYDRILQAAESGGGGGGSTLIEKSISDNGVYNASDDSADGYSKVTVDVPNTYTAEDEGKVVDNGTLVSQTTHAEITENGTYDITTNNSVSVNVSGGGDANAVFANTPASFYTSTNLKSIEIPNGITSIASYAFDNFTNIESVVIPIGVVSIGTNAFYSCKNLKSINIPSGVTSIGNSTFRYCDHLKNIIIPDTINTIGNSAFRDCARLESITFTSQLPPTLGGDSVFTNVPTTCTFYVPTGTLSAYTSAQYYPDTNTYTYVEY
jgi:hypothetical protein